MTCSEIISSENQEAEEFLTHYLLEDIIVIRAVMVSLIITLRRIIVTHKNCTSTYLKFDYECHSMTYNSNRYHTQTKLHSHFVFSF